jgi:hypothetical protein
VSPRLAACCAIALAGVSGCYFSRTPSAPHGHLPLEPDRLGLITLPAAPAALSSPKVIVLGRFDTAATQPIGGLYDFSDFDTSPLLRTYYFKHAALELFEHTCDALRATGLDVRKDYGTTGEPGLVESETRKLRPTIVRTRIVSLQHDQIRSDSDPPADLELVRLTADVSVLDHQGVSLYQGRHLVEGRMPWREDLDMLRIVGLKLGDRLTRDAGFLSAVGAQPRGGP